MENLAVAVAKRCTLSCQAFISTPARSLWPTLCEPRSEGPSGPLSWVEKPLLDHRATTLPELCGARQRSCNGVTFVIVKAMLGLCWANPMPNVGARMWRFCCPTNPVSELCLTVLMLAIMELRLRLSGFMLGICWPYVGRKVGYLDGWVGLWWSDIPIFVGCKSQGFGSP